MNWLTQIWIAIFAQGWISSVFWNLLVGIFVWFFTVLFIERGIEKRGDEKEKKRWELSKIVVYAKLFRSANILLDTVIPSELRGRVKRVCLFDNNLPIFYYEFPDFTSDSWYGLSDEQWINYSKLAFRIREDVDKFLDAIHEVYSYNALLIDSDFHKMLSNIDLFLTTNIDDIIELKDTQSPIPSGAYFEVVNTVIGFREYLIRGHKVMTEKEYINGVLSHEYGYFRA